MDGELLAQVRELTAAESAPVQAARARAESAVPLPSPEVGALLWWLATTMSARSAVEVGAAGGVTGLWLLEGMATKGVLTSIERDPHVHSLAAEAFDALAAGPRVRAILGDPDEVLPRLADASYDLLLLQGSAFRVIDPLEHAHRLLRVHGILVARGVLAKGDHAEARARFLPAITDHPGFASVVLPLDDGVVLATRLPDEEQQDLDEHAAA
jgi:predicted O-methyltransferase YrrM